VNTKQFIASRGFSAADFNAWAKKLQLTKPALAKIERIRSSAPSRRTMARGNIRGFYPSLKMAQSIQFESGHSELPAIIEMEHSFDVLEFWDQPEPIRLSYINADGRRCTYEATPDFLVMRQESVGWMECKLQEELLELVKEGSTLYCLDEKGIWRCPPGEQYAAQFGLTFTVYSSRRRTTTPLIGRRR